MKPPEFPENAAGRRQGTVLESVEEIRSLVRRGATARDSLPETLPIATPGREAGAAEPFRPVERPSMALLTVLDDGDDAGEVVRVRKATFVIGRVDGDLVIPHDAGISSRHAEVSRRPEGGQNRWYLRDLQSTNGTFVRASSVVLHHGQEVLVGRCRLRFEEAGLPPEQAALPGPAPADATRRWQAVSPRELAAAARPSLVELTPEGEGRRFPLHEPEVWVGRDRAACSVVLDDPTVDARHSRAFRDPRKRWVLENARSVNGLWARVQEVPLDRGGQFQCGEQRFLIKVL